MKVSELISKLINMPQEDEVWITVDQDGNCNGGCDITEVAHVGETEEDSAYTFIWVDENPDHIMVRRKEDIPERPLTIDELPAFIKVSELGRLLTVSITEAYKIAKSDGFPRIRLSASGRRGRIVIPKAGLVEWLNSEERKEKNK